MLLKSMDSKAVTLRLLAVVCASLSLLLFVAACGGQSADKHSSRTYLDDVRPACVKLPGSINEPCARRQPWSIGRMVSVSVTFSRDVISDLPFDVEYEFRRAWERSEGVSTPQVIVRGTVLPGSTRCRSEKVIIWGDGTYTLDNGGRPYEVCYVEVAANEYIVGRGPERVTVVAGWNLFVNENVPGYGTAAYYRDIGDPIRDSMEGIEFVFPLVQPSNLGHGEWYYSDLWDVQRRADGTIVGVSWWIDVFGKRDNWSGFEHPLPELVRMMKSAHVKVAAEYGGRIAKSPSSPLLINDAHRDDLLGQLRELGAYDVPGITPVPAPPAPDLRKSIGR